MCTNICISPVICIIIGTSIYYFVDWDFGDCELDTEPVDNNDSLENVQKNKNKTICLHNTDPDIYRLSGFDYDITRKYIFFQI